MENNLKNIRKEKHLNQIKVAMDLNLSQETISGYETGRILINSDILVKLANYYDTSVDYILGLSSFNLPSDKIKDFSITSDDILILEKIKKLSDINLIKLTSYLDGLIDKE